MASRRIFVDKLWISRHFLLLRFNQPMILICSSFCIDVGIYAALPLPTFCFWRWEAIQFQASVTGEAVLKLSCSLLSRLLPSRPVMAGLSASTFIELKRISILFPAIKYLTSEHHFCSFGGRCSCIKGCFVGKMAVLLVVVHNWHHLLLG